MSCLLAEPVGAADFYLVPLGTCSLLKMWLCCPQPLNLRFRLLALTPFENKCLFQTPMSLVKWHKQNNFNKAHLFFLFFCRGHFNCLFIFTSLVNCWVRSVSALHSLFLFTVCSSSATQTQFVVPCSKASTAVSVIHFSVSTYWDTFGLSGVLWEGYH